MGPDSSTSNDHPFMKVSRLLPERLAHQYECGEFIGDGQFNWTSIVGTSQYGLAKEVAWIQHAVLFARPKSAGLDGHIRRPFPVEHGHMHAIGIISIWSYFDACVRVIWTRVGSGEHQIVLVNGRLELIDVQCAVYDHII